MTLVVLTLGALFLWATRMLLELGPIDLLGKHAHDAGKLPDGYLVKDTPMFVRDCDHHSPTRCGDFIGHIIPRHFLLDHFVSMHTAQGGLDHRHHVVSNQRRAKAEQRRPGIAKGIDF